MPKSMVFRTELTSYVATTLTLSRLWKERKRQKRSEDELHQHQHQGLFSICCGKNYVYSSIFCHDDPYPCGIDAFYLSPPWGGPSYYQKSQQTEFDLRTDMVIDGFKVFKLAKLITPNIVLFLPKNTSISQVNDYSFTVGVGS
jgi:hypothetical protein